MRHFDGEQACVDVGCLLDRRHRDANGGERGCSAAMWVIQRRWPVTSHHGWFSAAHEDRYRHVGDVEPDVVPMAVHPLMDLVVISQSSAIEMSTQRLRIGEA